MNDRIRISLGGIFPTALFLYLGRSREIAAILLPVFFHEAGHALAIWLLGLRIRRLRLEMRGFCLEYYGETGAVGHALAAAAGPLAGLVFAVGASLLEKHLQADWLSLSAGVSLLLSAFNLLPALPLDGGRILLTISCAFCGERRGERLTEAVSLFTGTALLALGILCMLRGYGVALLISAIWLLLFQDNGRGLVKRREMI